MRRWRQRAEESGHRWLQREIWDLVRGRKGKMGNRWMRGYYPPHAQIKMGNSFSANTLPISVGMDLGKGGGQ
jgi:hypothetical protein